MADITVMRTPAETGIAQLFDRLKGSLPGDPSARESAIAGFAERGLPHRRIEEFKYTDLRAFMREALLLPRSRARPTSPSPSITRAPSRGFPPPGSRS
jgi:hypothetical protein